MNTRKILGYSLSGIVIIAYSILFTSINYRHWYDDKVEVGDIWYNITGDIDDPFAELDTTYIEVLAVKDGYVLYQRAEWKSWKTSDTLDWFTYRFNKKKQKDE